MNLRLQRLGGLRASDRRERAGRLWNVRYQFDLLSHLVWRDFSLRYKQSALGILWSLLLPFAQLLVMVFLFQAVVPLGIEAYPAFVFSALLAWNWFSSSLSSACWLFVGNRDLVRHPNFAPARLMLVNTLSNLITYLAALPILFAVLIAYGRPLSFALLALPLLMVIQAVLTVGLSMVIATLNVFYRDVQHIVAVLLMLLFYLTPVFYRPQSVASKYTLVYAVNPIAVLVQAYRSIFFEGVLPSWGRLLYVLAVSLVAYGVGALIYGRQQHDIIDTI